MKKCMLIVLLLLMMLTGCTNDTYTEEVEHAAVPENFGEVIEIATSEFYTVFAEYEELKITETKTWARTDDKTNIVIQFTYTSQNGDGEYGFEYVKDAYGNYEILQQGEDVTIDNLVGE